MSVTVTNLTNHRVSFGHVSLDVGASKVVDYYDTTMANAVTAGYISVSPTQASMQIASITDNSTGTPGNTIAAITAPAANATTSLTADMTAVRDALASLAARNNILSSTLSTVLAQNATLEARLDRITAD